VSAAWTTVIVVGAATMAIKGLGPVVLGGRPLPPLLDRLTLTLAPAVLAALVATSTFASGESLVLDERAAGVAAGGAMVAFRAPLLAVIVTAAAVTALLRLVG
jgi:branched-subunit amino acid transport protein